MLSSEVAMTDAEKESEARCKEMLNYLIAVVKKQTLEIEDLAESMKELAVGLKAVVQPPGATAHAWPLPVPAPMATLVTAVDHAVAAAAPRAEAVPAPESPTNTKCSTSGPDTNAGDLQVVAEFDPETGVPTVAPALAEHSSAPSLKLFSTIKQDTLMPTRYSTNCPDRSISAPTSVRATAVPPTSSSTIATLEIGNIFIGNTVDTDHRDTAAGIGTMASTNCLRECPRLVAGDISVTNLIIVGSATCIMGLQPKPPWPPPQGPETVLKLFHKQARVQSWLTMFHNAEMDILNSLAHKVMLEALGPARKMECCRVLFVQGSKWIPGVRLRPVKKIAETIKGRDGGFAELFMTKVDFGAKFDSCLRIKLKGNSKVTALNFCLDDESWRVLEKDVQCLLQQGLTDRTKMIRVLWRSTPSEWNIMDGFSEFGSSPLLVGTMLSSLEKSFRLVDIGANPENGDEAVKFRKFWGKKAELRRFKDGTIAESTVWECESWEKHTIIKRIADYVLTKHLSLQKEDLIHVVDQLDFCLLVGGQDPVSSSGALFEAFDTLAKQLRLLDDVPLKISTVQPLDSAFRHTSVFPPEPHPLAYENSSQRLPNFTATCIRSLEVMIQLEGSGNWPLDPVAMEKTKSAFLLRIGESLEDRGMLVTASEDEVNVLTSGYSFLLKIFHERGLLLPKQAGDGNTQHAPSEDKELFLRSQHSSMINGLHGRYQVYGPVVRLAKRWISAHLFSSFISEEAVELVVAYLFLKPFPYHAPSSRVAGFLRFLRLLSSFDWTFSPMVIDINNDFNLKDEKEINENFMLSRKSYEQNPQDIEPAMFLATSYDKASEAWTKHSPSKSVLKRMASYAKSSAELLTNLILHGQSGQYTWECLFRTPLSNYDAVVLLHQEKLCRPHHVLFPAETPNGKLVIWGKPSKDFHPYMPLNKGVVKSLHDAREKLLVNFDPTANFLRDLKCAFPKTFKLWYDSVGGDAVGLTWENSKKRVRDEADETMPEPTSILKEVGDVGKGLVRGVYLLKAPKLQ